MLGLAELELPGSMQHEHGGSDYEILRLLANSGLVYTSSV